MLTPDVYAVAISEICTRLVGIPLAIELATASDYFAMTLIFQYDDAGSCERFVISASALCSMIFSP